MTKPSPPDKMCFDVCDECEYIERYTKYSVPAIYSSYMNGDTGFVVTKLHARRTVLPIAGASSLGHINQNMKELHELSLHVFRV